MNKEIVEKLLQAQLGEWLQKPQYFGEFFRETFLNKNRKQIDFMMKQKNRSSNNN